MTIKTKAQLDAIFADAGPGDITPADLRDLLESVNVGFHIWCDGGEDAQAVGIGWVQVNQFNQQGIKRGWTFAPGIKAICDEGAQGVCRYDATVVLGGDAGLFDVSLFKLPATELEQTRTRMAGQSLGSMCGFCQVEAGDEIALAIRKTVGSANVDLLRGTSLVLLRIE